MQILQEYKFVNEENNNILGNYKNSNQEYVNLKNPYYISKEIQSESSESEDEDDDKLKNVKDLREYQQKNMKQKLFEF